MAWTGPAHLNSTYGKEEEYGLLLTFYFQMFISVRDAGAVRDHLVQLHFSDDEMWGKLSDTVAETKLLQYKSRDSKPYFHFCPSPTLISLVITFVLTFLTSDPTEETPDWPKGSPQPDRSSVTTREFPQTIMMCCSFNST